jgi:hypothetical protein
VKAHGHALKASCGEVTGSFTEVTGVTRNR